MLCRIVEFFIVLGTLAFTLATISAVIIQGSLGEAVLLVGFACAFTSFGLCVGAMFVWGAFDLACDLGAWGRGEVSRYWRTVEWYLMVTGGRFGRRSKK